MTHSKRPVTVVANHNLNVPSPSQLSHPNPNIISSRSSFCSFSNSTSRPDWGVVSHLFADALFELQVLNLDHASEPTATDKAVQTALTSGLPSTAVPSVLTESEPPTPFVPKGGPGLGYRNSVLSTASRTRSTAKRKVAGKAVEGLHIPTGPVSPYASAATSPAVVPDPSGLDQMSRDITTTLIANERIRRTEKLDRQSGEHSSTFYSHSPSGSVSLSVAGHPDSQNESVSRPTSRSRPLSRGSQRHQSVSRSRSRSRIRSHASTVLRRSIEIVRPGAAWSNLGSSPDQTESDQGRPSTDSVSSAFLSPTSAMAPAVAASNPPNPSLTSDSPHRIRRPRFVPTARTAIPEEGEEDQQPIANPGKSILIVPSEPRVPTAPLPVLKVPAISLRQPDRQRRLSRTASLRQLFTFRSGHSNASRNTPNSSTPSSRRPSISLPSPSSQSRPHTPEPARLRVGHFRSQSQSTTISTSPSLAPTMMTTMTTATTNTAAGGTRPQRQARRRRRLSQFLVSSFRASSTPPPEATEFDDRAEIDRGRKTQEFEKAKRRLSRFRSSIFEAGSSSDKDKSGKLVRSKSSAVLSESSSPLAAQQLEKSQSAVVVSSVAPPVPPPPPMSLSVSSPSYINPSDMDPLSFLHVQHRAITDRFDKFVSTQRLCLAEYRSRAMKRVVEAHIVARVPLTEKLRQYEKAEKGYLEFCHKMRQSGLITSGPKLISQSAASASQGDGDCSKGDDGLEVETESRNGNSGFTVSFDSGIALPTVDTSESQSRSGEHQFSSDRLSVQTADVNVPPSPVPSPTSSVFSERGTSVSGSTARTTPFPSPHTSNPPPVKPSVSEPGTMPAVGSDSTANSSGVNKAARPISIPQPPSSPAHTAALLQLSRLDSSMNTQANRLVDAFDGYASKLDDLFTYRAERIAGRWLLESREVIWRWVQAEKEKEKSRARADDGDADRSAEEQKAGDGIAHGVLAEPGIADRLDVSCVIVPLGWEWRGF